MFQRRCTGQLSIKRAIDRVVVPTRLFSMVGLAACASSSYAQDFADAMNESVFENIETISSSPTNPLPGHNTGDRVKPKDEQVDEADTDESQEPEEPREWFRGAAWWDWSHATGDWGGLRSDLERSGITIEGAFVGDWYSIVSGGVSHQTEFLHLIDVNIGLDLEQIVGIKNGTVFVDFYTARHDSISAYAGDLQGISNIETGVDRTQIAEFWYEQWLFDDKVRVKVGKVDANTEFAFVDAASEFITSSAGVSPAIFVIPTYPDPATSINVFVYPTDELYFGFGIYDGASGVDGVPTGSRGPGSFFQDNLSDDYFYILEAGLSWERLGGSFGPGRLAAGGWYHGGQFMRFSGGIEDGTTGWYGLAEQQIWSRDNEDTQDNGGLSAFCQIGQADSEVSEVEFHIACGLFLQGTFPSRADDGVGIYVSFANLSDAAGLTEDESILEVFYKAQLTPAMSIKPDLQWITNPSGDPAVADALALGLRLEIAF